MQISKEMKVWAEKNTICIQVNPYYVYYAKVVRIGNKDDDPSIPSMWGWINHLSEKVWWNNELQKSFTDLCSLIYE